MSKASYAKNNHIYWTVLCSHETNGKKHEYLYIGYNSSYTGSLEEAKRVCVWGKHPTFKAKVVGIRFE